MPGIALQNLNVCTTNKDQAPPTKPVPMPLLCSLVPRSLPPFQCCTLKRGEGQVRDVTHATSQIIERGRDAPRTLPQNIICIISPTYIRTRVLPIARVTHALYIALCSVERGIKQSNNTRVEIQPEGRRSRTANKRLTVKGAITMLT